MCLHSSSSTLLVVFALASMIYRSVQLVAAHRVFLKEGELDKSCRGGVVKARYCFLFSDLFIYTRKVVHAKEMYDYKHSLHVKKVALLSRLKPMELLAGSRKSQKLAYTNSQLSRGFKIYADERDAIFFAATPKLCQEWYKVSATASFRLH